MRPLNQKERERGESLPWRVKNNTIEMTQFDPDDKAGRKPQKYSFLFDHCFNESATNEQVYQKVARKVVMSCLEGYNGTIFMYGQTGSGKTHTMLGYTHSAGLYNTGMLENKQEIPTNEYGPEHIDQSAEDLGIEDIYAKYPDYVYDSNHVDFQKNTGVLIQSLTDIFKAIENVATSITVGHRAHLFPQVLLF